MAIVASQRTINKVIKTIDDNEQYLINIPCKCSDTCEASFCVYVSPAIFYNDESGLDLIKKRLSWHHKRGVPIDDATRKYKHRHKPKRYGQFSLYDLEALTKLGNVKDDISFIKFKQTGYMAKNRYDTDKHITNEAFRDKYGADENTGSMAIRWNTAKDKWIRYYDDGIITLSAKKFYSFTGSSG